MHNWKAKKLLALLLSIVMVLGLLPMSALAADTTETADAPITVTAGGKACTLEQIENESYLIYRVVFYPEQDITITPADESNNVTLMSLSSMLIYDHAGNAMENLDSATLPADMIEQNKMDADQLASLPGYVEVENTQYASAITVDVKNSEEAVVAQAVLYLVTVEAPAVVPVDTLELSQNELTLTVGKTATLTATVGPENATDKTVTWSVDGDAATVKDGVVTAVKAGEAIVTATSGSATASCKVTVEEAVVETDMVINNAADLKSFAAKVSAGNTTINGIVKADIDLSSDTEFFGIGTADHPYAGDFDGGDHTITLKLSIKWNDANADDCMGLIAYAGGARIHNVVLAGSLAVENSAGLVGCTVSGETTIENCINNAAMTGKDHPIGGILGDAKAQVSILNCVNNGTIGPSSLSSTAKSGSGRGGIVGALNAENCVVESCVNHGEMVCLTIGGYSSGYGGIVGSLAGKGSRVTKCYNDAKITGYLVVGGIAASAGDGTTIESCYNAGDLMIRQINGYKQGLGGILGVSGGDSSDVTVQDVYNVGKITALEGYGGSSAAGVGGIVAYIRNSAEITNAYNAGTVTVGGATVHGSVLGYAYKNTCKVSNCYWLEGTDDAMFSGKYVAITGVDTPASTSDALKALYTDLGDGFKKDAGKVNQGYPVLKWQVSEAPDPVITGIKITNAPTKTVYEAGENFDPTGMTVAAVYDDEHEEAITDFTVEGGDNLTVETTKVTVKYGDFTTTQAITVNAPETEMEIYTADDLVSFANKVKAGKTTLKGILKADIDMSEVTDFFGIGTEANPYAGEFVGNDYTVTVDMHVSGTFGTNNRAGLIAFAGGAYIYDVTLKGVIGAYNGCGIVGCTVSGETKIENCTNYAVMNGNFPTGGILGEAKAKVTILGCVNYGEIGSTDKTGMTSYGNENGGIAGKLSAEGCVIENCYNHGELINPSIAGGVVRVGGIVGEVSGKNCVIRGCYNDAKISANCDLGGIVGTAGEGLTIESCYNTGLINGMYVNSGQQGVGGILGTAAYRNNVVIKNVYNTGKVTDSSSGSTASGAGGIVGYVNRTSSITNAYNAGTVSVSGQTPHGSIIGGSYKSTATLTNVSWLEGTDPTMCSGTYTTSSTGTTTPASTSDALKALYTALGDGFKQDAGNVNSGYPVLEWQTSEAPKLTGIKITKAPAKTEYTAGEDFDPTGMTVVAVYDNGNEVEITDYTVEGGESLTASTTKITVKYDTFTAEQPITVNEAPSGDYELRVLTFEDADYKGGTNFAGGNDWTSLIDNPQYGGKLLYSDDGQGTTDVEKAYTWFDENNTELSHTLPYSFKNYCYWSGGHAISHYVTSNFTEYGDFNHQLTVYSKDATTEIGTTGGGHNGSNNFAVHYGYKDNTSYTTGQVLPAISFKDGVERVVDHMYVNNIAYAIKCYIDGNSLTAKIGPDDWVKLTATGYDSEGNKTGEASIYLCNGPDEIIMDWTKFDLSGLGKVLKVEFNITGSSDNGYGFSQPAYFAYDDVAVRFEKGTTYQLGDVNRDGEVNVVDVQLVYAFYRGYADLDDEQQILADFNKDGKWNVMDCLAIYASYH